MRNIKCKCVIAVHAKKAGASRHTTKSQRQTNEPGFFPVSEARVFPDIMLYSEPAPSCAL